MTIAIFICSCKSKWKAKGENAAAPTREQKSTMQSAVHGADSWANKSDEDVLATQQVCYLL